MKIVSVNLDRFGKYVHAKLENGSHANRFTRPTHSGGETATSGAKIDDVQFRPSRVRLNPRHGASQAGTPPKPPQIRAAGRPLRPPWKFHFRHAEERTSPGLPNECAFTETKRLGGCRRLAFAKFLSFQVLHSARPQAPRCSQMSPMSSRLSESSSNSKAIDAFRLVTSLANCRYCSRRRNCSSSSGKTNRMKARANCGTLPKSILTI